AAEPLPAISEEAELAIFRALQEGLANVIRHASAQAVDVRLRVEGTELVLRMQDDGAGFRAGSEIAEFEERGRMGLVGMRERLAGVGGSLTIEPGNERGVQIAARVPVSDEVSAV
ncbi:MAG: hypothetical protein PVH40_02790, partial [Gemmatimonadales bacterium]